MKIFPQEITIHPNYYIVTPIDIEYYYNKKKYSDLYQNINIFIYTYTYTYTYKIK